MSKKLLKIHEEKLLISRNIETQIEKLMVLTYEELNGNDKITLHSIMARRYYMVGRYEA